MINVETVHMELLETHVFKPSAEQSLEDWLEDRKRHSSGGRLPRNMHWISPLNNRPWFEDSVMSSIRCVIFSFNIPASRFGSTCCSFGALLLGGTLREDDSRQEFSVPKTCEAVSV